MCSFHARLIELESEIIAKEEAEAGIAELTPDCQVMLEMVEKEVGVKLADRVPGDFRGWISYRRLKENLHELVINRGRAFKEGGLFPRHLAGCDVSFGFLTIQTQASTTDSLSSLCGSSSISASKIKR